MVPRLSYYAGQHNKQQFDTLLKKASDSVMAIACGVPILFCVFANETIVLIGGDSYLKATWTMVVLNLCVIVLGATWIMGVGVLQTCGRQNLYAKTMWIAVAINIFVNILLIPHFGATGAATATLITEISNAVMFYHYSELDVYFKNIQIGGGLKRRNSMSGSSTANKRARVHTSNSEAGPSNSRLNATADVVQCETCKGAYRKRYYSNCRRQDSC